MSEARYYVVGEHDVWMIKFEDAEYGAHAVHGEVVFFAIDAAQRLGRQGERAHVCVVDEDGHFRSKWTYDCDHAHNRKGQATQRGEGNGPAAAFANRA